MRPNAGRRALSTGIFFLCVIISAMSAGPSAPEGCPHTQFSTSATAAQMVGSCGDLVMVSGRQVRGRVVVTGERSFDVYRFEVVAGSALSWWGADSVETMASGSRISNVDVASAHSGQDKLSVNMTSSEWPNLLVLWDAFEGKAAGRLWLKSPDGVIQTFLPQPTFMDNCQQLAPNIRLRWSVGRKGKEVEFGVEGIVGEQRYISFGPAKPGTSDRLMAGSDVAVAGVHKGVPFVGDFYITNYEECNVGSPVEELRGVCEDSTWGGGDKSLDSMNISYAHQLGGVTFIRYARAFDTGDSRFDHKITPNSHQTFIWAIGAITPSAGTASGILPRFHGSSTGVDYGSVSLLLNRTNSSAASANTSNATAYVRWDTWDCPALAAGPEPPQPSNTVDQECLGDAGDSFETRFPMSAQLDSAGRVRVFWSVSSQDSTLSMGLRVSKEVPEGGYVSVGIGPGMAGAASYVGWIDQGGEQIVQGYYMDDYEASGMIPTGEVLEDVTVKRNKLGGLSMTFTRPLDPQAAGPNDSGRIERLRTGRVEGGSTPLIWAIGPSWHLVPLPGDIHTDRSSGAVLVNLISGGAEGGAGIVRSAIVAHAVCMCIAWLLLTPLAVMCARYLKGEEVFGSYMAWLNAHQALVWAAVAIMIAGLVVVVVDLEGKPHLRTSHSQIGVAALVILIPQATVGIVQSLFWMQSLRIVHQLLALVSAGLVVACFVTGVQELIWQFAIPEESLGRAVGALAAWLVFLGLLCAWREYDVNRKSDGDGADAGVGGRDDADQERGGDGEEKRGGVDDKTAEQAGVSGPDENDLREDADHSPSGITVLQVPSVDGSQRASDGKAGVMLPAASLGMFWISVAALGSIVFVLLSLLAANVFTPHKPAVDKCAAPTIDRDITSSSSDAAVVLERYPNCKAFPLEHVGDGWCDSEARFNAEECGWDGGDCCIKATGLYDCKDPGHANIGQKSPTGPLYPVPRNPRYSAGERGLSSSDVVWGYNNFYEFGFSKYVAESVGEQKEFLAGREPGGWPVEISGLVASPQTIDVYDLLAYFQMEERDYRHRCVEAWSIAVPWVGFPLSRLIDWLQPKEGAKYIKFTSFKDTKRSKIQEQGSGYNWPYVEGLTLEEARNELAFVAIGSYQQALKPQMGPPIRLVVPWKYGFKSIKSISKIELVTSQLVEGDKSK